MGIRFARIRPVEPGLAHGVSMLDQTPSNFIVEVQELFLHATTGHGPLTLANASTQINVTSLECHERILEAGDWILGCITQGHCKSPNTMSSRILSKHVRHEIEGLGSNLCRYTCMKASCIWNLSALLSLTPSIPRIETHSSVACALLKSLRRFTYRYREPINHW